MKKAIEISVLRVSSNGKYIEFIINCPRDYYFTDFVINVEGGTDKYSLKESLFIPPTEYEGADIIDGPDEQRYFNRHFYSGQVKIEDLGVDVPEIYEINIEAWHNPYADSEEENEMEKNDCWTPDPVINVHAYISDVSKAYTCMMDDILAMGSGEKICEDSELTDRIIRNYLILYAHQEAMHMHEIYEARKYFTFLNKCFNKCSTLKTMTGSCKLCNGGTLVETVRFNTYKPSCGCVK